MRRSLLAALSLALVSACGGGRTSPATAVASKGGAVGGASAPADELGPRPDAPSPDAFLPPAPATWTLPNGVTVWFVERHAAPVLTVEVSVPHGAAEDPPGREGLAALAADLMDEGAGARTALELSDSIDSLGASLEAVARTDYSSVSLHALTRHAARALPLLVDVIARPRFDAADFARVRAERLDALREREHDPAALSAALLGRLVYGDRHPYGHPADGWWSTLSRVTLGEVRAFHASRWTTSRATCVVVGDVTRSELDALLATTVAAWPRREAREVKAPAAALDAAREPRVVLVDRPGAPQSVVALARPSVAAQSPEGDALWRANAALGGGFTSRLNLDLREQRAISYGAHSALRFARGPGLFVAQAAVVAEKTGEGIEAMLAQLEGLASRGITDDELVKTRLLARGELVGAYGSAAHIAARLARNASVGLGPAHEIDSARARAEATKARIDEAARRWFPPSGMSVLVVGPIAQIQAQLPQSLRDRAEVWSPSGERLRGPGAAKP